MNKRETMPLISVGVPVYNGEAYLERCLSSLRALDYENLEIIICENGSKDSSRRICQRHAAEDPRIRLLLREETLTAWSNFLNVLSHAKGEFFFWAACDDCWAPDFVSRLQAALEASPETSLAICGYEVYSESRDEYIRGTFGPQDNPNHWPRFRLLISALFNHEYKMVCGVYGLYRRDFLVDIVAVIGEGSWMDRVMMIVVCTASPLAYVDEILYFRTSQKKSVKERYGDDPSASAHEAPAYKYLLSCLILWACLLRCKRVNWVGRLFSPLLVACYCIDRWIAYRRGIEKRKRRIRRFGRSA